MKTIEKIGQQITNIASKTAKIETFKKRAQNFAKKNDCEIIIFADSVFEVYKNTDGWACYGGYFKLKTRH